MDEKTLQSMSRDDLINYLKDIHAQCIGGRDNFLELKIHYGDLVETASDIIFVLDRKGNLVYHNSSWKEMFGQDSNEAVGKHFAEFLPAIEIDRANVVFKAVLTEGASIINEKMKTLDKNGNIVYFIANFTPINSMDGKSRGLLGIMRNITDIHLMEKKLRENSRRLEEKVKEQIEQAEELKRLKTLNEEIIQNAPIGIFMMDPTGIMLSDNPMLRRIMGHPPNESRIGYNLLQHEGFIEAGLTKAFDKVIATRKGVSVRNSSYVPISRDRLLTLNWRMDPILDSEKNVKSVLLMVEDITEQAQIASRMQRAEKISAVGLLATGVAYELKVPINLMTIDLNFIENNIDANTPVFDYVKSIKDELVRMRNITDQLLNLSKPDEEDWEVFEVNKIIDSHPIQIMLKRMMENGYEIVTDLSKENPRVRGIKNQLVQVLVHLISNAEEAMPEKGKLTLFVQVVQKEQSRFVNITVEDTGIGIPPENVQRIFQPFFTTKGQKSTGLGLMVTHSIIENFGGLMGIKSKPGEGTRIRIMLPIAEE